MTVRVLQVITTLERAGAELLLQRTASHLDPDRVCGEVVCLGPRGEVAELLEDAGWTVHSLGMCAGRLAPGDLRRLRRVVDEVAPDVVHSWMYHADLVGGLVARWRRRPVIWSLHQSALPAGDIRGSTRAIARLDAGLSWAVPSRIVATSRAAARFHRRLGYRGSRIVDIPTAFDVAEPVEARRIEQLRAELGVPPQAPLVGRVGRFHAQKDYPTMLAAARVVLTEHPDAHVVLVGRGVTADNPALELPADPDPRRRLHLLGERADVDVLTAALDVAVSSSAFGESTPLVIGEAMAAGVPVVTTDVGDSGELVADTGRIVPPRAPDRLAAAILELLAMESARRQELGAAAQRRIREHYSIEVMAERYARLYEQVAADARRATPAARPGRGGS